MNALSMKPPLDIRIKSTNLFIHREDIRVMLLCGIFPTCINVSTLMLHYSIDIM